MMMKVIIVAIYQRRADVVAQPQPPLHHPYPQTIFLSHTSTRSHTHCLQFIRWLAAIARHSSKAISSRCWRTGDYHTHGSTSRPSAGFPHPPSSRFTVPRRHRLATTTVSFLKFSNALCLSFGTFSYASKRRLFATP